jgi:hypothetical protein
MLAVAGVIAMLESVLGVTVGVTARAAVPLTPFTEAVTVVEPPETPVASPVELMVAMLAFATVQFAVELTFDVDPSL